LGTNGCFLEKLRDVINKNVVVEAKKTLIFDDFEGFFWSPFPISSG